MRHGLVRLFVSVYGCMLCLVRYLFVILTSVIDCLGRFVHKMTYYVLSGTLNLTKLKLKLPSQNHVKVLYFSIDVLLYTSVDVSIYRISCVIAKWTNFNLGILNHHQNSSELFYMRIATRLSQHLIGT